MVNSSPASPGQGPFFDDLTVGQAFVNAPAVTLTEGLAAAHQAITGDRLALPLDHELCREVTGGGPIAPPALVWDVAIGQSTVVTRHVKANLFYRGLAFRRIPVIGDTLRTHTSVVALRQNSARPGREPTGLVALRITTIDQEQRPVLDFWRCAMLPLRDPRAQTGHADDLDRIGLDEPPPDFAAPVARWRLRHLADRSDGPHPAGLRAGQRIDVAGGDVVSSGPELARLTLNVAAVHHDARAAGGERLVYGGHVIALALSQAVRALPAVATVVGWHSCDHLGPVREGDTLRSSIEIERTDRIAGSPDLVHLRSLVRADGPADRDVLDWRYVAVLA
jgi:acyl dehydratase